MTLTSTRPSPADGTTDDDTISHIVCCDENTALCGLDVTHYPWLDVPERYDCPLCVLIDDTETFCASPNCPGVV
jgi:hypothetical protein